MYRHSEGGERARTRKPPLCRAAVGVHSRVPALSKTIEEPEGARRMRTGPVVAYAPISSRAGQQRYRTTTARETPRVVFDETGSRRTSAVRERSGDPCGSDHRRVSRLTCYIMHIKPKSQHCITRRRPRRKLNRRTKRVVFYTAHLRRVRWRI